MRCSWNIEFSGNELFLINDASTKIRKHKGVPFGVITDVLSKMEELQFPIEYTNGIEEIYFTYLRNNLEGDYFDGKIRIGCNNKYLKTIHSTLIHEIGHHVDFNESISSCESIKSEWKKNGSLFVHRDMEDEWKGPGEYFAIGFENYYMGEPFSKEHKNLHKKIRNIHKQISR